MVRIVERHCCEQDSERQNGAPGIQAMKLIVDNITPFSEDLGHFKDALALANISIETCVRPRSPNPKRIVAGGRLWQRAQNIRGGRSNHLLKKMAKRRRL